LHSADHCEIIHRKTGSAGDGTPPLGDASSISGSVFLLQNTAILKLKNAGLDGLEGYYPEYTDEMGTKFRTWAKQLGLLLSGGSDYHANMKPHIEIGRGIQNNLNIPDEILDKILLRLNCK
jgi:predicted metal-dependent phosphoesterase TrpH